MSLTNVALNSRSLNGIITISDGTATLENGDLNCDDINSNSLSTSTINTTLLNCLGKFECNSNGVYTIPTLISTVKGLLISYGNTLNNGSTDFTNFQSTYTSTKGGFNFWNKSSTQTLTNLGIIDNSQTYFKSQLIGCTAETPVNNNSIVNKTYVDTNFVDLINQQIISGNKIFNDTLTVLNNITYQDILASIPVKEIQTYLTGNILTYMPLFNLNIYNFITKNAVGVAKDALKITNTDMTTNCNFITNNQNTFNNFAPISNTTPTISTHLTTKNYTDSTFQTIAGMSNYVDITTNQTIGGDKTFTGTTFMRDDIRMRDIFSPNTNEQQIFQEGSVFTFNPLYNLNTYRFITKSALGVQKDALEITNNIITTNSDLIVNNQAIFNNYAPISNTTPTISTHLTTKNYTDSTFQTIANMTNYVDVATNNQIVSGSKIFTNDQLFKANLKIYDQTALSVKYMQASQNIDTFTLQSQNGQASQFQISLQNVAGAYNTILSMNSNQATVAGSLSVNSTFTSNSNSILKNSNTFGTLTSDVQTVKSWLDLTFRTRIYDILGSGNHTQMYMIGNSFIIYPIPNSGAIEFYAKNSVGTEFNVFSFTALLNTCRVPLTCLQQTTFNTVAPLCSIAPTLGNHLCNKTYVDSVGASSILASNNTFTGTNTFSNDITLSKTKNNSTYATYNGLTGSYIGYFTESVASTYLSTSTNTQYDCGGFTVSQIGFYNVNYEVELNSVGVASTITKIYLFISDNNVSTTIPINYPGAKANNFSTQTYTAGDSTYHSGSFTFLHNPANNNIYALQLKIIYATGSIQRKSVIRFTRVI